jgi:hypothetical protein
MSGTIPPLPQYVFMTWCLVKHRDNLTFTFCFSFYIIRLKNQGGYDLRGMQNARGEISISFKFWIENIKGGDSLVELGVAGKIILI